MNVFLWAGVILIGGAGSVARFLADGLVGVGGRPVTSPSAPSPSTCPAR